MSETRKPSAYSIFLHLALITLAVQVFLLQRENRILKRPPTQESLETGDTVEAFAALGFDGTEQTVAFAAESRESLVLVFTTKCPICADNLAAWTDLYERYHQDYRVVGIAIGDLEEAQAYSEGHALPYPVVVPVGSESFAEEYEITGVPTTIRVGTDGQVKDVWLGRLPADFSLS